MSNKSERSELTPCNGMPCTDTAHNHPSPLRQALDKAREVNVEAGINFLNRASALTCKTDESLALLKDFRDHLNRKISELEDAPNHYRSNADAFDLGAELFDLVERDQGYAFVPIAISGLPDERVFDIARGALKHTEIVAQKIRQWLKKHNQNPCAL